jgi:hypothetical protein
MFNGQQPPPRTSPEMWGALLAGARLRRVRHLWKAQPPAVDDDTVTRLLVRAYVVPEDEQTRRLASSARGA